MEIKFRVWGGKTMTYPEDSLERGEQAYTGPAFWWLYQGGQVCSVGEDWRGEIIDFHEDAVAMLSIGILDRTGKDIYADDIVENESGRRCLVTLFTSSSFSGWDLKAINHQGCIPNGDLWVGWTILGNIHENPELIPKGAK